MCRAPPLFSLSLLVLAAVAGWATCLPRVRRSTTKVSVSYGSNVSLACDTEDIEGQWVRWDKMDTGHILALETHVFTDDHRLTVSIIDNTSWVLNIHNVQAEDEGPYKCTVNTSPITTQTVFLEVLDVPVAPSIVNSSSNFITVQERSSVVLSCHFSGDPKPDVKWTREDQKPIHLLVNKTSSSGEPKWTTLSRMSFEGEILRLPLISRTDAGSYRCTASNTASSEATKVINLEVAYPPDRVTVSGPREARVGDNVTFRCGVHNSNPTAKVSWMVESESFPAVTTETEKRLDGGYNSISTLSIVIPATAGREMMFTCLAVNPALGIMEVDTYILPILEAELPIDFRSVNEILNSPKQETKYMADDINPKRGRVEDTSDKSVKRRKINPSRAAFLNTLTFLRFFGLLMSYY